MALRHIWRKGFSLLLRWWCARPIAAMIAPPGVKLPYNARNGNFEAFLR